MTAYPHLNETARELFRLSDRERMEFPASDLWIDHSQASQTQRTPRTGSGAETSRKTV